MSKEDAINLTPNKLRGMKKYYPEEYFERSGYPMNGKNEEYY